MIQDSKQRFSNRVQEYNKYRPSYPPEVLALLQSKYSLSQEHIIADIGSGTGISSEIFLKNNHMVYAVEPNKEMRLQAQRNLSKNLKFKSVDGQAEATKLADQSIDFIVTAQAFHWFDLLATRAEFRRILKPHGVVVILFNDRLTVGSDFAEKYEQLMNDFGIDYREIKHKNRELKQSRYNEFFKDYDEYEFPYTQHLNFEALLGRTQSSSYMPKPEHPNFTKMLKCLEGIFNSCSAGGHVDMKYATQMLCSRELRS